ncbi:TonB-dependent receptor [Hymenobacter sp. 5516J-16]|uniref:carboxypeptidase-like regulatory domain-containing protein n=1 Tax=Hymenobacter sp. 5516J-16 TaxID=2932253 RepID=UPI001FD3C114|nr:carboxypeptidase-like regulatory domain-containing protein [Hymenobacter sp. 5516J-16]UOQ77578.1 TonB-dependent receptor [Hymenobacter sp. 5516J-16]
MNTLHHLGLISTLSVCALSASAQQTGSIRGTITTADGRPAEAVTVGLKGRGQGAISNNQGQFVIERVRDGQYTVVVTAVGLKSEERAVTVSGGQSVSLDFTLTENAEQLREVVVNGARVNRFARKESIDVNKMPLSNLENPQVYATVGKELLTEQLVFSVDEATRNAPGVQKMWEATGRSGDGARSTPRGALWYQASCATVWPAGSPAPLMPSIWRSWRLSKALRPRSTARP